MSLSAVQLAQLKRIVAIAEKLIAKAGSAEIKRPERADAKPMRMRRSGKELAAFRKMLKSELKKGASVADVAQAHGISRAYLYQLK